MVRATLLSTLVGREGVASPVPPLDRPAQQTSSFAVLQLSSQLFPARADETPESWRKPRLHDKEKNNNNMKNENK